MKPWAHGLAAAFIGGGAQAAVVYKVLGLHDLTTVGVLFLTGGIMSVLTYLAKSPLPDKE